MEQGPRIYRQGDVLLHEVDSIPATAQIAERDAGRLVLAYGEVSGRAHVIDAPDEQATLLTIAENERFLRLVADVDLVHEEHASIHLPAGLYQVVRQRVWTDADADAEDEERWRYAGD